MAVLSDYRSQDLMSLLMKDRGFRTTTSARQVAYRQQAESKVGQGENLYRLEWVRGSDLHLEKLAI